MKGKFFALAASMLLSLGALNASAQSYDHEHGRQFRHHHEMNRAEARPGMDGRRDMHKKELVVDKNCRECKLEVRNAKMAHRHAKKARRFEDKARHERAVAHQYASKAGSNYHHHHHHHHN